MVHCRWGLTLRSTGVVGMMRVPLDSSSEQRQRQHQLRKHGQLKPYQIFVLAIKLLLLLFFGRYFKEIYNNARIRVSVYMEQYSGQKSNGGRQHGLLKLLHIHELWAQINLLVSCVHASFRTNWFFSTHKPFLMLLSSMFFLSWYFLHVSQTERSSDQIGSRADTENVVNLKFKIFRVNVNLTSGKTFTHMWSKSSRKGTTRARYLFVITTFSVEFR